MLCEQVAMAASNGGRGPGVNEMAFPAMEKQIASAGFRMNRLPDLVSHKDVCCRESRCPSSSLSRTGSHEFEILTAVSLNRFGFSLLKSAIE
jgi:hypothetical protein